MSSSSITSVPTLSTNASSMSGIDQLVQMYIQSVSQPVTNLQNQQSQVNSLISIYQSLKKKLTDFQTQASSLASVGTLSPLSAKSATPSNTSILTATAQATAAAATHSLLVTQLAKNDTLVSNQFSQTGTDISGAGTGAFTFSITVDGTATNVNVNVNSGDTNSTVLANIASAVNAANAGVYASVVNDTNSTARLVFQSANSGSANAISVADVTGTLAANVGWSSSVISGRTASSSTTGGFVNSSTAALDANFTLDGIPIVRGSNTVSDVLTGVTLSLAGTQQPTDNPVTLTVGADTSSIQTSVNSFISAYNTAINYLNQNITDTTSTASDGTQSVTRGALAGDVTAMNLQMGLQNIVMSQITSAQSGGPNALSTIGITLANDGTLSISDKTKFTNAVTSNPSGVMALFNSSNGVAVQLNTLLNQYVHPGGVMDQEINGSQDQVTAMSNQIQAMQANINIQADAVRQQYSAYESMLIQLNQTQSNLNSIWSGMQSSGMVV